MAAEENDHDGSRCHGSLAARKIRGRPRHGTELGSRNRCENAERSSRQDPARQPSPLPDQARHAPLLKANPYSEVTDPICRLPLPTLVYRLESLHLGNLLRIWIRTGATHPRGPLLDFQGPRGKIRTPLQLRCFSRSKPYFPARGFQGTRTLIQKKKLFPDLPTASPSHFGIPRRTLLRGPELYAVPLPGSGIGTGFPFARRACASHSALHYIIVFLYALCVWTLEYRTPSLT
ncbi:hypothetical protein P5V15_002847 [Pogonomyrmex californicus]